MAKGPLRKLNCLPADYRQILLRSISENVSKIKPRQLNVIRMHAACPSACDKLVLDFIGIFTSCPAAH
jgi:hypothetical protein